jgi:hypothetical protein
MREDLRWEKGVYRRDVEGYDKIRGIVGMEYLVRGGGGYFSRGINNRELIEMGGELWRGWKRGGGFGEGGGIDSEVG